MYKSPLITQSNPPRGTGHAMSGGSSPIQDRVHLGGLAGESACAIHSTWEGQMSSDGKRVW